MKTRFSNPVDKDRMLMGTMGVFIWAVASLLVSAIILFGWGSLSLYFGVPFTKKVGGKIVYTDPKLVNELSVICTLFVYVLIFAMPLMRKVIKGNGGLGLKTKDLPKRLNVDEGRHKSPIVFAWSKAVVIGLVSGLGLLGFNQLVSNLLKFLPGGDKDVTMNITTKIILTAIKDGFTGNDSIVIAFLLALFTLFLAPFLEEMFFRGLVARSFMKSSFGQGQALNKNGDPEDPSKRPGVVRTVLMSFVCGVIFGLVHIQFTGNTYADVLSFVTTTIVGVVFTWISASKYDSIWPTFFGHFTYNTITMVMGLLLI